MKDAPSHFQILVNAAIGASDYFLKDGRDYLNRNLSDYTKKAPYEAFGKDYKAQMSDFKKGPVLENTNCEEFSVTAVFIFSRISERREVV